MRSSRIRQVYVLDGSFGRGRRALWLSCCGLSGCHRCDGADVAHYWCCRCKFTYAHHARTRTEARTNTSGFVYRMLRVKVP